MIDKQIKTNKTKSKSNCETCIHNVVCKEKENYNKYVQELDELEINNAYFENVSRECRYYLNKDLVYTRRNENLFKENKPKESKNIKPDDLKTNSENFEDILENYSHNLTRSLASWQFTQYI